MRTWPGTSSGLVGSSSHTGSSSRNARAARIASSTLQRMLASTISGNSGPRCARIARTRSMPCYAGGIDLDLSVDALLRQTDDNLARGFRAVKMKVGRPSLRQDIERVRAMRAHLGPEFPLMVDANMRWSVDEAIRAARALRELDPVWLEEPTSPDDVPGHVRIVREGGLPIAAGENLHTLHEFRHLIAAGGVTFPEPDVTNCGGVTTFMKVCHLAEAFNLPVTSHGAHDVTVHLLAAAPNRSYLEAHGFGLDRFIAEPLRLEAGAAVAPERSGHGIEFDWKALDAVRARSV